MEINEKIIELDQNTIENLDSDVEFSNSNVMPDVEDLKKKLKKSKTKNIVLSIILGVFILFTVAVSIITFNVIKVLSHILEHY